MKKMDRLQWFDFLTAITDHYPIRNDIWEKLLQLRPKSISDREESDYLVG